MVTPNPKSHSLIPYQPEISLPSTHQAFAVRYSPFKSVFAPGVSRLACVTSTNFGLHKSGGRLYIFDVAQPGTIKCPPRLVTTYESPSAIYDCAWSESNRSLIAVPSNDGMLRLLNIDVPPGAAAHKETEWKAHNAEIHAVDWSCMNASLISTASWDGSARIWDISRPAASTFQTKLPEGTMIYQAAFAPHTPNVMAMTSSDPHVRIFDIRSSEPSLIVQNAHASGEIVTTDWNKYNKTVVATASAVDGVIRVWDLRQPGSPVSTHTGHKRGIRRIKWSPWRADQISSVGYDMTARVWHVGANISSAPIVWEGHSEFVTGLDYDMSTEVDTGTLTTCSWDSSMHFLQYK